MDKIVIRNSKGLFGQSAYANVISAHGISTLLKALDKYEKEMGSDAPPAWSPKELESIKKGLHLIAQLPQKTVMICALDNDHPGVKKGQAPSGYHSRWEFTKCHAVVTCQSFSGKINTYEVKDDDAVTQENLDQSQFVAKNLSGFPALRKFAAAHHVSFMEGSIKSVIKMGGRIESGDLSVELYEDVLSFGSSIAYAIFIPDKQGGGYLDNNKCISQLSSARLFESEGAAERTIRAQRLSNAVIVKSKIEIESIVASSIKEARSGKSFDRLTDSIAKAQKEALKKALDTASVEDLKRAFGALRRR